jgi:outer membrane protein insertion porin family
MLSNVGVHEFTVATVLRQITSLTPTASPSIVSSAGDTIKTSLSHTLIRDRRDDTLLPTQGYILKTTQEYAGLGGGDIRFLKGSIETQFIHTFAKIWPRVHFICGLRGGVLHTLNGKTNLTDRFYLGGPTDVRGFREFGIGPKDRSILLLRERLNADDSVGGEAFLACSASVMFPVPNVPSHWPLRFQAFVNGGSLLPLQKGASTGDAG